ncbi:hypothetical protein Gotri_016015 [Gossypium trilobum]|uniref:Uncharacterized protein n=1 Tax=Gossypium trilobum TaxID=34281 RepID=A0A7J9E227_9ROSI|nr:hypothetical protein [Gossypium trilobum]
MVLRGTLILPLSEEFIISWKW